MSLDYLTLYLSARLGLMEYWWFLKIPLKIPQWFSIGNAKHIGILLSSVSILPLSSNIGAEWGRRSDSVKVPEKGMVKSPSFSSAEELILNTLCKDIEGFFLYEFNIKRKKTLSWSSIQPLHHFLLFPSGHSSFCSTQDWSQTVHFGGTRSHRRGDIGEARWWQLFTKRGFSIIL